MSFTGQERKGSGRASDSGTDAGQGALALPGSGSAAPWEKDCFRLSHLIAPFQPLRYPKRLSQIPFFKALSALFSCSMKSLSRGHLLCTGDSRGLKRPPGQHFPNFPVQHEEGIYGGKGSLISKMGTCCTFWSLLRARQHTFTYLKRP